MLSYLFVLGRTRELSFIELSRLFDPIIRISPSIAGIDASSLSGMSIESVMGLVGGTTKIAKRLGVITTLDAQSLAAFLDTSSSVVFGLSGYDGARVSGLSQEIKKILKDQSISARYIEAKDGEDISTVASQKEHIQELIITKSEEGYIVGHVEAVQLFEEWSKRDYDRPFADAKLGMLPPKVSRMAVNCALGRHAHGKTLLDPFCGMGTVLGEALLEGVTVIGNDLSEDVVNKAKANIEWLKKAYVVDGQASFFVGDATHISMRIPANSVDAIVTEPFMGAAIDSHISRTEEKVKNTIKGLEKLYIGCLKDWHTVLKPGGTICMAFPEYRVGDKTYFVKKVIDTCENFGYTKQVGPIEYSRPQAIVKREFFLLTKAV